MLNTRIRVKHCATCDRYFHRDVAAGQLIVSLAKRMFNNERYPEQFNRPDRPPVPPAAVPPANTMDLPHIKEASVSHDPAHSNPEEEASQDGTEHDPGQANQAHQAHIQTLRRKRKLKFNTNEFPKKTTFVQSKWL